MEIGLDPTNSVIKRLWCSNNNNISNKGTINNGSYLTSCLMERHGVVLTNTFSS